MKNSGEGASHLRAFKRIAEHDDNPCLDTDALEVFSDGRIYFEAGRTVLKRWPAAALILELAPVNDKAPHEAGLCRVHQDRHYMRPEASSSRLTGMLTNAKRLSFTCCAMLLVASMSGLLLCGRSGCVGVVLFLAWLKLVFS